MVPFKATNLTILSRFTNSVAPRLNRHSKVHQSNVFLIGNLLETKIVPKSTFLGVRLAGYLTNDSIIRNIGYQKCGRVIRLLNPTGVFQMS